MFFAPGESCINTPRKGDIYYGYVEPFYDKQRKESVFLTLAPFSKTDFTAGAKNTYGSIEP
jgi:hypothetical protein